MHRLVSVVALVLLVGAALPAMVSVAPADGSSHVRQSGSENVTVTSANLSRVRVERVTVDRLLVSDLETPAGGRDVVTRTDVVLTNVTLSGVAVETLSTTDAAPLAALFGESLTGSSVRANGTTVVARLHVRALVVQGLFVDRVTTVSAASPNRTVEPVRRVGALTVDRLLVRSARVRALALSDAARGSPNRSANASAGPSVRVVSVGTATVRNATVEGSTLGNGTL